MVLASKIKSIDFFRKIPRDLTEASLSGAGLSIVAAVSMLFLFGLELRAYLTITTTTSVVVDRNSDSDFLLIGFNMSFPSLSCEFASLDVSDVLGTNKLNITKTVRKYAINKHLQATGAEVEPIPVFSTTKHNDKIEEEYYGEGSVTLTSHNFDRISHSHPILVVDFYAPWCGWSKRLKPTWENAARILRERHNPETDGRILMGKVDCTAEKEICTRHHIQGYPTIRIFRGGSDVRDPQGQHETYYGARDTDSLVEAMEHLINPLGSQKPSLDDKYGKTIIYAKRPAPQEGGCRLEGAVQVKKVPGNIIISTNSDSHSFDASHINMSHVINNFNFGNRMTTTTMSDLKRLRPDIGSHDELAGKAYINLEDRENVTIEHFLHVVKTEVIGSSYQLIEDYEYTVQSSLVQADSLPVAKFHFEPSPIKILVTEDPKLLTRFITNVCAIIGGVFTVAGLLNSLLYNTMKAVQKVELGKDF